MMISFEYSLLALISPFVGLAITAIFFFLRQQSILPCSKRFILVRGLTATVLILLIAKPMLLSVQRAQRTAIAIDVSDSMEESSATDLLQRGISLRQTDDSSKQIIFAEKPTASDQTNRSFVSLRKDGSALNRGETDIGEALKLAANDQPSAILLISDGFPTVGDEAGLLKIAEDLSIPLFPIAPDQASPPLPTVRITQLDVPLIVAAGETASLRVSVRNTTDVNRDGVLTVMHGEKKVFVRKISLRSMEESVIVAKSDPSLDSIQQVVARFTPSDKEISESVERSMLATAPRDRILLLNGTVTDARYLEKILRDLGYEIDSLIADKDGDLTRSPSRYSAIILNNIPYKKLGDKFANQIASYVKNGGGLVMIGGDRSFGLGGYIDTPFESLAPVKMLPPRTEKKRVNVAVSLILDKSRSMASDQKLLFAKEAAKEVIRNLKDEDFVGVMGFDSTPFVVVRLDEVRTTRARAIERVDRLFPAGRTNLLPAIDEARRSLTRVSAGRKHVIILTDGKLPDSGSYYIELIRQMRIAGITVSTVLLGGGLPDDVLQSMATAGGGNFYQTEDAQSLPRIFLQDVKVSTGEKTLRESSDVAVTRGPGRLVSTTLTSFPLLRGYVQTAPRDGANLELTLHSQEGDEPLLASWDKPGGKVIAFTSDSNGRWSSDWLRWRKFAQFWSEIISTVHPKTGAFDETIRFGLRHHVSQGALVLEPTLYSEATRPLTATVTLPDGDSTQVSFNEDYVGHFQGTILKALPGTYQIDLRAGNRALLPVAIDVSGTLFGEKRGQGFNRSFLEKLAEVTGGKVNPRFEDLQRIAKERIETTDVSAILFVMLLLLLALEMAIKELPRKVAV